MASSVRIAVDAMGGEFGPSVTVSALISSLKRHPFVEADLFGNKAAIAVELNQASSQVKNRISVYHSDVEVCDNDKPSTVLRNKKDSSMGLAINAVATRQVDACISAGNTGALMALGLINLKTLPGISRPAICTTFPTVEGRTYVLDLGANIHSSAGQLHEFAILADLTARLLDNIGNPTVRLLNVGVEDIKGSEELQQASLLLEGDSSINYVGFIEGDGIFEGIADIVVCDGFSGNIALKTTEGFANMISVILEDLVKKNWLARLVLGVFSRSFKDLKNRLDPSLYNGAYLLGLDGVVVKSHGSASRKAFGHALDVAIEAAAHNLPKALSPLLQAKLIDTTN